MTDFAQTDSTTTTCHVGSNYCLGGTNNSNRTILLNSEGGTAGSGTQTTTMDASADNYNAIWLEIDDGTNNLENLDGATGNWTFRLNVSSANANVSWTGVGACRITSGCVNQETICSDITISTSLGTTGVKTATVNQGSTITMAATELVMMLYQFDNSQASTQAFNWVADQNTSNQWAPAAAGGVPDTLTLMGVA